MQLVIVESPTKARKLTEYLGSGYKVEASVGHVRDLPKKKLGIDLDHDFQPTYEVDPGKRDVVAKLRSLAQKADKIYLATDPDREGEAIAWHIQHLLLEKSNLTADHFSRATFHEITKKAVTDALEHPSSVQMPLVDAQQARRVVDRLVGYQVSPVLWKKVRRGLSAGRVQSVALRMIVEREREIEIFKPEEYWEVDVALSTMATGFSRPLFADHKLTKNAPPEVMAARLTAVNDRAFEPHQASDVEPILKQLPTATYVVSQVERKTRERASLPPFTTSTLQQAAANKLGFTSKQTMTLAQQLYEEGLITYHRTDSVSLSSQAIVQFRDYIQATYGADFLPAQPRRFANKSKNAQEAHEAIRITHVTTTSAGIAQRSARFTERHQRLYELIWKRSVASQMSAAVYDQTALHLTGRPEGQSADVYTLKSNGSVMKFAGWTILMSSSEDTLLPSVSEGQQLTYGDHNAAQKFTQPPARYNDASLVKELEKRGIGRPSTYASIISVIVDRGYVERKEKRFWATAVGMTVSDFLLQHFATFMEYDFTAEMEEDLDRISRGEKNWTSVVKAFYGPLAQTIAQVTDQAERVQIPVEETGEICPKCGSTEGGKIVIRTGRFGKFKSCNRFPDCDFTENIVEKVAGVQCPLCQQGEVVVKPTRWGRSFYGCSRYPDCAWASWTKPKPGTVITQAEWKQSQAERAERAKARAAQRATGQSKKSSTAKGKKKAKPTTQKTAKKTKKSTPKKTKASKAV